MVSILYNDFVMVANTSKKIALLSLENDSFTGATAFQKIVSCTNTDPQKISK